MSYVTIDQAKDFLRVIHTDDDSLIQSLLDAAEEEAKRFLNRSQLPTLPHDFPESSSSEDVPSDGDPVVADVQVAIMILVQARYEGDTPEHQAAMRRNAETLLMPYRVDIGV